LSYISVYAALLFYKELFTMIRIFAYCRLTASDPTADNQRREIEAAGFAIESKCIVSEAVSGFLPAMERKGFVQLLGAMKAGDVLVVTKLDRLGHSATDVNATVERLASAKIRVHCVALGDVDLTSAAGKITMQVIAAGAEFERDLLVERMQAGLSRAKAAGKRLGRPMALTIAQQAEILEKRNLGVSLRALAKEYGTSLASVQRAEARAAEKGASGILAYSGTAELDSYRYRPKIAVRRTNREEASRETRQPR
jgi:putative DNA-invertase from lambdoid prophage Rac